MKNSVKYFLAVLAVIFISGTVLLVIYMIKNEPEMNPAYYQGGSRNLPSANEPILDSIVCGETDPLYCESDNDCICAADETQYPGCFMGNKAYYKKCEDKKLSCSDGCTRGRPPVKCINNKCSNSYNRTGSGS